MSFSQLCPVVSGSFGRSLRELTKVQPQKPSRLTQFQPQKPGAADFLLSKMGPSLVLTTTAVVRTCGARRARASRRPRRSWHICRLCRRCRSNEPGVKQASIVDPISQAKVHRLCPVPRGQVRGGCVFLRVHFWGWL